MTADHFTLYDLSVTVARIDGRCTCDMRIGDQVLLRGGRLNLPDGQGFCLYALQATLPLLPAKQRPTDPADWMTTDALVTCPDPACGLLMRLARAGATTFRHDDVSATPLAGDEPSDPTLDH